MAKNKALIRLINASGVTRHELAGRAQLSEPTIRRMTNGLPVRYEKALALAEALGTTVEAAGIVVLDPAPAV